MMVCSLLHRVSSQALDVSDGLHAQHTLGHVAGNNRHPTFPSTSIWKEHFALKSPYGAVCVTDNWLCILFTYLLLQVLKIPQRLSVSEDKNYTELLNICHDVMICQMEDKMVTFRNRLKLPLNIVENLQGKNYQML